MTSFFKLMRHAELCEHVETYLGAPYWKDLLSSKVLPSLDKGWRLVGNGYCLGCYNGCCEYYGWTHEVYDWLSREQSIIEEKALHEPDAMSAEDKWVDPTVLAFDERLRMEYADSWQEPAVREQIAIFGMQAEDPLWRYFRGEVEPWGEWVEDVWCAFDGTFWRYIDGALLEQEDW